MLKSPEAVAAWQRPRTQLEKQLGHSVVSPINAAQVLAAKKTEQIEGEKDKD